MFDWSDESATYFDQATPGDSTLKVDLRYLRWMFEKRYVPMILSRFRWFGTPPQIDSPQIEQARCYYGAICGIKRISRVVPEIFPIRLSGVNEYGKPIVVQPLNWVGADIPLSEIEVDPATGEPMIVWEYGNDLHLTQGLGTSEPRGMQRLWDFWHDRLAQAMASVIIADYNARVSRVFVGTEDMSETIRGIQRDTINGYFAFIVDEQMDLQARAQSLNVAPDAQMRTMAWDNFYRILNEYLAFVGVPYNANQGKTSGVSPYEIAIGHEYSSAFAETELYRCLSFCDKYNDKFWPYLIPQAADGSGPAINPETGKRYDIDPKWAIPLQVIRM